jgi:hypothetical protein
MSEPDTAPAPDFFGHTIFCDDIRFEVDGKATFVGAYPAGVLLVRSEFPITIPKFCFGMFFFQKKELFRSNVGLRIFLPGDTDEKPSIEAELQAPAEPPSVGHPMDGQYTMIGSNVVLSPFAIERPGRIKVRVLREGILHRIGSIRVAAFPEVQHVTASNET